METLKSIMRVTSSNIFNLGSSFVLGFILPIYISTFDYGKYKEYMLYLTFIYIFNLGFNDGIYIEYGGKTQDEIEKGRFQSEARFVRILQIIILAVLLITAFILKNKLLFYISFASYFMNVIQFHKNFLQATGEFALYSKLNMLNTLFNMALMLMAIFIFNVKGYSGYIIVNLIGLILTYLFYEYYYYQHIGKNIEKRLTLSKIELTVLFKVGITILLSNMMVTFVANIGSWVVNLFYSTEEFAQYSFSTSLINIILLIVNAVSLVFYNLIAKNENPKMLIQLKKMLLILGVIGGLGYFIFSLIIKIYISKYIPSLNILAITFISIPYIMVSNVIFNNIYKTRNNKKMYLKDMIKFLSISILLIGITTFVTDKIHYIAIATTGAYIIWYLLISKFKFTYLQDGRKEIILMISHIVIFWSTTNFVSEIYGGILYSLYLLLVLLIYRKDFLEMIKSLK